MKTATILKILSCILLFSSISLSQTDYNWVELTYPPEHPVCQPVTNDYHHIFVGGESGLSVPLMTDSFGN